MKTKGIEKSADTGRYLHVSNTELRNRHEDVKSAVDGIEETKGYDYS
jgi:hypothetical protein